ncbi:MAG TPA: PilC/PilY family type IV pilus protein [Casimicrobiaceae bacterium]|nr:PilC/PilY family type IV pilus protein [Casimicrobiaceae bacterium]
MLSLHLAVGPLATTAYAAPTPLADEPIGFAPSAPPNLMLTVDDSTSMLSDFLPDYVIGAVPNASPAVGGFCRDLYGAMQWACGYSGSATSPQHIYSFLYTPFPYYATGTPPNPFPYSWSTIPDWIRAWPAPAHNNALNRLYYDPAITYTPPLRYDGVPYPDQTVFTAVPADPWSAAPQNQDLTANVLVGMWCNSLWPNDYNWNPLTGGGSECRINGTDYSSVASAPAKADYQYPYYSDASTEATWYFVGPTAWGLGGTDWSWEKPIYCDTTHPKWPQTYGGCTLTYSCPGSETLIPPTYEAQSCFREGSFSGCLSYTTDYSPPGCNTNPAYGAPGPCTGSECLVCNANTYCTSSGPIGEYGYCHLTATGLGGSGASCYCYGVGCTLPACPDVETAPQRCSGGGPPIGTYSCVLVPEYPSHCGQYLWDPVNQVPTSTTLLADSEGLGEVCRHSNKTYDGIPGTRFGYPSGRFNTGIRTYCPAVPSVASVPRHYWKTSVEWCTTRIDPSYATHNKWRGFGQGGTCQVEHDDTHPYPRFYKYGVARGSAEHVDNDTYPAFERVDLVSGSTYTHTFRRGLLPVTITRTYLEEMTNYANWFAYYRTRIQAAKTVISQNFVYLDEDYRVGFHTLSNNPTSSFVNIAPFDAAPSGQKDTWYSQLFAIDITMGKQTPTLDAVVRIGEHFKNGGEPSLVGSTDPIVLSCQKNYHMLFTDGITNQSALPSLTVGNLDSIVPALPQPLTVVPPIVSGSPWPPLFKEGGASQSDTLADYTTYYWVTDMRPAMINNVLIGKDPAPWQHLNFAALSLGTEGTLPGTSPVAVEAQIAAGARVWPDVLPNSWQPNATGVDDLWHAAVNARGRFVNAKTSQQLGRGIAAILSDITSPAGSNVGATFANPNLSITNDFTYIAKFVQGWGGNLQKFRIDPVTAATLSVLWDAEAALITQTTPTGADPEPWYTKRRIVTVNDSGTGVAFLRASLSPAQRTTLGSSAAAQDSVIEYLRGRRDLEGDDEGQFRVRASPLGDIVNSQAQLIGPLSTDYWDYTEANDPGYTAFKAAYASRPARVYVGANDGMLHAFNDTTGAEEWAFIPSDLYRGPPNDKAGLIGLTYQPGGLPIYAHRFYVDSSPRIADIDVSNVGSGWKTLLVGGLGKGGKSYFALDVTDPASVTDETTAAGKILWEFRNNDLGWTYGRPMITKTRAFGWTVIVSSGYNNASGQGKLFFIRPSDGALLKTMTTGFGSPGSPSGMTHISGFTKDFRDQTTEQIYAGDLYGNVWRFDVSDPNEANWVVKKFAYLTDGSGVPQPITTPPRLDVDPANGVDRWVVVGTGKLLHEDDLADLQLQRLYAMRDGTYTTPTPHADPPLTWSDLQAVSGVAGLGTGVIAAKGWYDDLPAGQRIVRAPATAVGLIAYISTGLPIDPCTVGQPANIYVRQFGNGESRLENAGVTVETIYEPTGAAGFDVIATYDAGCTENCVPNIKLAVVSSSNSQLITFQAKLPNNLGAHRLSWRTLSQ